MCLGDVAMSVARTDCSDSDREDSDFHMYSPINENQVSQYTVSPRSHSGIAPSITPQQSRCNNRSGPMLSASSDEVVVMLQQQQAILQQVLKGQEDLKSRQDEIEEKLSCLDAKVKSTVNSVSPSSSSSDGKRKRIVTRTLSVSLLPFELSIASVLLIPSE